jgi:3-oxoadipate enol-lactonase
MLMLRSGIDALLAEVTRAIGDNATPVSTADLIRSRIPGASMTILDAAHISNVEQPDAFTDAVVGFLTQR